MSGSIEYNRLIKYAILQTTIVPSLLCDLFVFIHFIRHWRKEIHTVPQNHVILCLIIISFIQKITDVPFVLYFLRWGVVIQQTYTFCIVWDWWGHSLICMNLHLLTWCCIERHLFIFHNQIMKKKWCLILFHYIPLIICLIYAPLFYLVVTFFERLCSNTWDYSLLFCGGACYSYIPFLGTFDWIFNYGISILVILLANLVLFCRVIWQKIKHQHSIRWSRQRRMIIQLIFISILYLTLISPQVVIGIIQALWVRTFLEDIQYNYFHYIVYFINQLLPFIIVSLLPEMHKDLKRWIGRIKQFHDGRTRVHPSLSTTAIDSHTISRNAI